MKLYTLLPSSTADDANISTETLGKEEPPIPKDGRGPWFDLQSLILVLVLFVTNGVWMFRSGTQHSGRDGSEVYYVQLPNGQTVGNQIAIPYAMSEEGFSDGNVTISNAYWRTMFPAGNGVVALSDLEVARFGLPPSFRGKTDQSKSIYMMAGLHQLHCLSHVRFILHNYYWNSSYIQKEATWNHTLHCMDNLRQRLLCAPDDSFMAEFHRGDLGVGDIKQCRNWTAYTEWAAEHQHGEGSEHYGASKIES